MSRFILVGEEPPSALEQWLLELCNSKEAPTFHKVAMVALPNDENISCLTAYFNMDQSDMQVAAGHLLFDAIDNFIKANLGRYRKMEVDEDDAGHDDYFFGPENDAGRDDEDWLFDSENDEK